MSSRSLSCGGCGSWKTFLPKRSKTSGMTRSVKRGKGMIWWSWGIKPMKDQKMEESCASKPANHPYPQISRDKVLINGSIRIVAPRDTL